MAAFSHQLASLLAARLSPVVPAPMSVRVHGSLVVVDIEDVRVADSDNAVIVDDDDDRTFEKKAATAVWGVLSAIQDDISEYLTEPWPAYGRRMALPGVRSEKGRLFLWYGDEEATPLVGFAPIDTNDLRRP